MTVLSTHCIWKFNFPLLKKLEHLVLLSIIFDNYLLTLLMYSFNKWASMCQTLGKMTTGTIWPQGAFSLKVKTENKHHNKGKCKMVQEHTQWFLPCLQVLGSSFLRRFIQVSFLLLLRLDIFLQVCLSILFSC